VLQRNPANAGQTHDQQSRNIFLVIGRKMGIETKFLAFEENCGPRRAFGVLRNHL
jgi:hypothetical protein